MKFFQKIELPPETAESFLRKFTGLKELKPDECATFSGMFIIRDGQLEIMVEDTYGRQINLRDNP